MIGVRWEGTPTGKIEKINGVDAYIATPEQDYPKDKVLLFLTDIFGMQLVNSQVRCPIFEFCGHSLTVLRSSWRTTSPPTASRP